MTRRRWIADQWNEASAALVDAQAAHLARVLRAQVGQEFDIVAGNEVRRGVIERVAEDRIEFSLHEAIESSDALPLVILLSIVRFERMEWAMEKLTELGVARIIPLVAQRSEKHLAQAAEKRVERWRKIARESAQQSRRSDIPEISAPTHLAQCITEGEKSPSTARLLLSEREHTQSLRRCLEGAFPNQHGATAERNFYAAIGPEGGWSDAEILLFSNHSWTAASLGPRILRAETAAIAVASVLGSWLTSASLPV